MRIAVVDHGVGNLRSVQKGLQHTGAADVIVSAEPGIIASAQGIVLPGVGAFPDAAANLHASGLWDVLLQRLEEGTPFLGICLGMQLLASSSVEDGRCEGLGEGLGVVPGVCERLPAGVKVPHIGWNTVAYKRQSRLFEGIPEGTAFYFVHSYHLVPDDPSWVIATAEHGVDFAAAIERGNVHAVQFHPEKSSSAGLRLLGNFVAIVEESASA